MLLTECTHSCQSITLDDLTISHPGGPLDLTEEQKKCLRKALLLFNSKQHAD